MPVRRLILVVLAAFSLFATPTLTAQETIQDLVDLEVEAGFGGRFRENYWLPLEINVRNSGDDLSGRLVVRPETSGRAVTNAYSAPVDLPTGSEKRVFLYIQAQSVPAPITVELLDGEGNRVTQTEVRLGVLEPAEQLNVLVTDPAAPAVALNGIGVPDVGAVDLRWSPAEVPDHAAALRPISLILLTNADTSTMIEAQMDALYNWVAGGGHLIVAGGPNWRGTTAGLEALLPIEIVDTQTVNSLAALGDLISSRSSLIGRSVIATGSVKDGAEVLASIDGEPVLVRGSYGAGTVDYLAADPALEPLRSWRDTDSFWLHLAESAHPRPAWTQGFVDPVAAATGLAVLPGIDLLPPITALVAFLGAYILLIGPINYWVLSRINRRGWAWVTIPLFITVFAVLAWTVGFNLRGRELILSRLTVVESWEDHDEARLQQLIGILSPRRSVYTMDIPEGQFLRVMPELPRPGILASNLSQSTAEIHQTGSEFTAERFAVDGGIFANFSTEGSIPRPDIGGTLALSYRRDGTQALQGAIRNDSEFALEDAVILARGIVYPLVNTFEPGDLVTLDGNDLLLALEEAIPAPAPMLYNYGLQIDNPLISRDTVRQRINQVTLNAVLGGEVEFEAETLEEREYTRRRAFLQSFLRNQYGSPALGYDAYLIGWMKSWPDEIDLGGIPLQTVDDTVFVVRLPVEVEPPAGQTVTVQPDQFTWMLRSVENSLLDVGGADDMLLTPEAGAELRFMPLPNAQLSELDTLTVTLDRSSSYGRSVDIFLYNWEIRDWELLGSRSLESYEIENPARFVGPDGVVDMRLYLDDAIGTARLRDIRIAQTGRF